MSNNLSLAFKQLSESCQYATASLQALGYVWKEHIREQYERAGKPYNHLIGCWHISGVFVEDEETAMRLWWKGLGY